VLSVQYAPDGGLFASGGADHKVFLYEGKEGDVKGEMGGHKGSVVSPSSTGKSIKLLWKRTLITMSRTLSRGVLIVKSWLLLRGIAR
jgi:WD40 repeat protein